MRNTGIEFLRIIGMFAVVVIHANSLKIFGNDIEVGFVLDELARFAVPSFFMFSGLFWKDEAIQGPLAQSRKMLFRLFPVFAIWAAIYLFLDLSSLLYPGTFQSSLAYYLIIPLTGGAGFHLWFLPALFMGAVLTLFSLNRFGLKVTFIMSAALYLIGTFLGFILFAAGYKIPSFLFRNGIFEAPIFLVAGYWMRGVTFDQKRVPAALIMIAGALLHILEGVIRGTYPSGHEYSFGTVLFAFGAVALFKSAKLDDHGWGRDVLGAYLIHLLYLKVFINYLPGASAIYGILVVLAVGTISLLTSRLLKMSRTTSWFVSA